MIKAQIHSFTTKEHLISTLSPSCFFRGCTKSFDVTKMGPFFYMNRRGPLAVTYAQGVKVNAPRPGHPPVDALEAFIHLPTHR